MTNKTKYCSKCKKHKNLEDFRSDGKRANGDTKRKRFCKKCENYQRRLQRIANREDLDKEEEERLKKEEEEKNLRQKLIKALVEVSRFDLNKLENISFKWFVKFTNSEDFFDNINFQELKDEAKDYLYSYGLHRNKNKELTPGTYIIVGDSHGEHTNNGIVKLIENLNEYLMADNVIHIGHLLDDKNLLNPRLINIPNLIVLNKLEESKHIEEFLNKNDNYTSYYEDIIDFDSIDFGFEVVREEINAGDFCISNQDLITDYVKTSLENIDPILFDQSSIVNCHRQEHFVRNSHDERSFIYSPGCLCEKHIIRTIKQIDFEDNKQVKVAYPDGFIKYRRMKNLYKLWQQGVLVLHLDEDNNVTIVPMKIKKNDSGYCTSYFDKIITEDTIESPENKIFVNGDLHCSYHDLKVLDIQEQICKDFSPDIFVNVGDTCNNKSLDHHILERYDIREQSKQNIIRDSADVNYILKRFSTWADKKYILFGNHERFFEDFYKKNPQLEDLLNFEMMSNLKKWGFELVDHKDILNINDCKFVHGDLLLFGQKGKKIEKIARTFGENTIMGHCHYPSSRLGCYSVGLSAELDLGYNEPVGSQWTHGFILCTQWKGETFISSLSIVNNNISINDKTYEPKNYTSWRTPNYKVRLEYDFEE